MLVPVHSAKASRRTCDAPRTPTPGANKSTHRPVMPSTQARSFSSEAPTVTAPRARPGENKHASSPRADPALFPAAATTATPRVSARARTAASSDRDARPAGTPSASVRTALRRDPVSSFARFKRRFAASASKCSATVSRPETTSDTKPFPSQSSTRMDTIAAAGARPACSPAASDATAVPWPKQSSKVESSSRPPRRNEFCEGETPL